MHLISPMRLARLRLLPLLIVLALFAGAACSEDEEGDSLKEDTAPTTGEERVSQEEVAKLKTVAAGKLTACTDTAAAPFGFEEGGTIDGIEPELVRALAGRFALNGELVATPAKDVLAALDSGKCDVAGVAVTDEVEKTHLVSEPYFVVYPSLLVRAADAERYKELAALKGRKVGVQTGSTSAAFLAKSGADATISELATPAELFSALEGNQIDAVVDDLPVNAYRASTSGGRTSVTTVFTDAEKKVYALAMARDRADLKKVIDDGLVQVKSDDTYPTVLRRFVGSFAAQALKDVGGP
ncbi:MAG TPA: ABC transporter substrate-binding protein [Acidimicrobiales bacterium]|nr:ABC transporter substrate-binding protein [Acidimicrobiales bacterium]